jgi:soluble lytic murein transglycosylase
LKTKDKDIIDLVLWLSYQKGYEGEGFEEIKAFTIKNSSWPRQKVLINRAEFALQDGVDPKKVLKYFDDREPVTGHAMRILAEAKIALGHDQREINDLLRQAWKQGDFHYDEEKKFIKDHFKRLRHEDHLNRIDRLLWEHKITDAKRIIRYVHSKYKTLFTARIYLITRGRGVDKIIARIDKDLLDNPGFLYERIQWHMKRRNYERVYNYLADINKKMPYPEKWWNIKNRIIRELIDLKEYEKAYYLARNHGNEGETADFAEGEWLAGWLSHSFLNNKNNAYEHFYTLYKNVNFPVSKARAGYWAGRSAEESGNSTIAKKWYKLAAEHQTTFYGQMALLKIATDKRMSLPASYSESYINQVKFKKNPLVKAAYLLIKADKHYMAKWFVKAAIDENNNLDEMHLISKLGIKLKETEFSVVAAKQALKKNVVLASTGWPVLANSKKLHSEKPVVMAIVRQESLFDSDAQSGAGARGLMQLMPATARHVSGKLGIKYRKSLLTANPEYNLQLGSYYINYLIEKFDGSYVLAIASYNAGPSNVRDWLERFGDPRKARTPEDVIHWIEQVPFKETRNYIQRVLENAQVYRYLLNNQVIALDQDLLRYKTKLSRN